MASTINELKSLVPPPERQPAQLDWVAIEAALGLQLPLDYKQVVEVYGHGSFDDFLWVLQPSGANPYLDLFGEKEARLGALRYLRDAGDYVPFGVEPGQEDLLPWAATDNGDVCYWLVAGSDDPDKWAIVVNESRGPDWDTFEMSISEFLVAVLSGALRVEIFPDDFPSDTPAFRPVTGLSE